MPLPKTEGLAAPALRNLLPYATLVLVHVVLAWPRTEPFIFADELGYLGHARYLAGVAPMPDMRETVFYHPGYSFFLTPAHWLFSDPRAVYKAVLVTNGFLLSLLFFPLRSWTRALGTLGRGQAGLVAFVTCLYPPYLLQSNIAWSESALLPAFAMLPVAVGKLVERKTGAWAAAFGFLGAFLYALHPRGLPVMGVAALYLIALGVSRVLPMGKAAIGLLALVLTGGATRVLIARLLPEGWGPGSELAGLDLATRLLSGAAIREAGREAAGGLLYLSLATLGLFPAAVLGLCLALAARLREGARAAASDPGFHRLLFLGLCTISLFIVSTIMLLRIRGVEVIYGRYNETWLSLYLALGLAGLAGSGLPALKRAWRLHLVVAGAILALAVAVRYSFEPRYLARRGTTPHALAIFPATREFRGFKPVPTALIALAGWILIERFSRKTLSGAAIAMGLFFALDAAYIQKNYFLRTEGEIRGSTSLADRIGKMEGVDRIGYDEAFTNNRAYPIRFFSYQFLLPRVRFERFDSRRGQLPKARVVISGRSWPHAKRLGARLVAEEKGVDQALWVLPDP